MQYFVTSKNFQPAISDEDLTAMLLTHSTRQVHISRPGKPDKESHGHKHKDKAPQNGTI